MHAITQQMTDMHFCPLFLLQSMACSSFSPPLGPLGCKALVFTWSSDPSPILNLTAPFPLAAYSPVASHLQLPEQPQRCLVLLHRGSGCGCIPGTALVKPCHLQPGEVTRRDSTYDLTIGHTSSIFQKNDIFLCYHIFLPRKDHTFSFALIC